MGRNNKSNRSKFQPSSSSSAFNQFNNNSSFVGFSSGRIPGASLSFLSGELQLAFKKASKKDDTTKIKAYTQLIHLFTTKEVDDNIDACLDTWCNIFRGLLLERTRRLREIGLKAHYEITNTAGRRLAPYLKRIIGPWLLFLHDSSRSCRSIASKALFNSIPEKKHINTWIFCKSEIIDFIYDRILQNKTSLCPPSIAKGIEADEIYEENMSSCLLSLSFIFKTIPKNEIMKIKDQCDELLQSDNLWKLGTFNSSIIPCSFLILIDSIIQYIPELLENQCEKIIFCFNILFKRKDRVICQNIWKPLITFLDYFSNNFNSIPPKKLRLFKNSFIELLQDSNCVISSYSYLNDLIPKFPDQITSDNKSKFYEQILGIIWKGSQNKVLTQKTEMLYCYINLLIYSLNNYFLKSCNMDDNPNWYIRIIKPFEMYMNNELGNITNGGEIFAKLFSNIDNNYSLHVIKLLDILLSTIKEYSEKSIKSNEEHDYIIMENIALFICGILNESTNQNIKSKIIIFNKDLLNNTIQENTLSSLKYINVITDNLIIKDYIDIPLIDWIKDLLLPLINDTILLYKSDTDHIICLINILSNILKQVDNSTHIYIWNEFLNLFISSINVNSINILYKFLKKNVILDTNISIWRHDILDNIVLDVCKLPSKQFNKLFSFIKYTFGNNIMTSDCSLINENTRITIITNILEQLQEYKSSSISEDLYSIHMIQAIVFKIKLVSDCLSTNLLSFNTTKELRLNALQIIFNLSVDIKYYWKNMNFDKESFKVSSIVNDNKFELSSNGFTIEQINKSPIALASKYTWDINYSSIMDKYSKEERINYILLLINDIQQEMGKCDITWFRPNIHILQVKMIMDITEHSSTEFVLNNIIQSKDIWKQTRNNINNIDLHIDYLKLDINYFSYLHNINDINNNSKISYARMLCFLHALINEYSLENIIGKSDYSRIWIIHELYCGYTLSKDLIIPPIDKSNEKQEAWAMVCEKLLPYINTKLKFPQILSDPFIKALVSYLLLNINNNNLNNNNNSLIETYAIGYIIRKLINGNNNLAEEFITTYIPLLIDDLSNNYNNDNILYKYQCFFPEILGNLKYNQCEKLGLTKIYHNNIEHIMNNEISYVILETLIHLSSKDGLLYDNNQRDVISSLFIFFTEWENQNLLLLNDPIIRILLLRFFICITSNNDMRILLENQQEFFSNFILKSIKLCDKQLNSKVYESLLFYSFKLSKNLIKYFYSETYKFDDLIKWLLSELEQSIYIKEFSPSQYNIYIVLCQSILVITKSSCLEFTDNQKQNLYKLLTKPHIGIQKSSYHLLLSTMNNIISINNEEDCPSLKSLISNNLYNIIYQDDNNIFEFLNISWICNDSFEDEDIGYFYRDNLVKLVSFCMGWILLCNLYSFQPSDSKKIWSFVLKEQVSKLLVFIFEYIDIRSLQYEPNQDINIISFDPCFSESLDQFICDLYLILLRTFPSLVREWWCTDCNRNLTNFVETYTTKYISPILIQKEIKTIQEYNHDFDNFEVKANSQLKQVQAFYEEDEVQLGINLLMPDSYPLRDISVTSEKKIGITEAKWRQWILSIHTLLHTQDANVLDAVLLWKSRMDKLFEGIECCLICYSVFQVSNNALPKLACKTCKNKFHSGCLYKWFNTSHKSNCPLCQTPWME